MINDAKRSPSAKKHMRDCSPGDQRLSRLQSAVYPGGVTFLFRSVVMVTNGEPLELARPSPCRRVRLGGRTRIRIRIRIRIRSGFRYITERPYRCFQNTGLRWVFWESLCVREGFICITLPS